jgi:phospholipase C
MPQIKKIIFLMLENRSLDNLLGWVYQGSRPLTVFPKGSSPQFDGLVEGKFSLPYSSSVSYPVIPIPDKYIGERVPAWDPYEEMYTAWSWNGVMNQLFGNQNMIGGMPGSGTSPTMKGFYQDYYSMAQGEWEGMDITWTYRGGLPIMSLLAKAYGVSDAWFCSVPTQTNPNRAYSLIGTSQGRENNLHYSAVETYVGETIFNALGKAGKSWGLYYTDLWQSPAKDQPKQCFTQYTFPNLTGAPNGEIATHDTFFQRLVDGSLPDFTYLEPKWGYGTDAYYVQGTDYHPPTNVMPGEAFLYQVFLTLAKSPQWDETLFIVTFDEHGGTYDHVAPPWGAINPDGIRGSYGFNFDLFGARVPTMLISPFVYPGSVFRAPANSAYPFDHTSFIKTLLGWAGADIPATTFGKRMPAAPTFDTFLADHPVNFGGLTSFQMPAMAETDPKDLTALFAGMGFAAVRDILHRDKTLEEIQADIARYRADPEGFEETLR